MMIGRNGEAYVFFVEIICPEEIVKRRISKRYEDRKDFSEADYGGYKMIRRHFEPIEEEHFVIDTGKERIEWQREMLHVANKIRIVEKQENIIDKLKKRYGMKLIQTHISWVLLDGSHAYKIKKPVRFSFVDYSSLKKRKRFCKRENDINSLLSPELYLGVIAIKSRAGRVSLNQQGEILEYAVEMVELPQGARMDNLIESGKAKREHIERIAKILEEFHRRTKAAAQKYGTASMIAENFRPVFETGPTVEEYLRYGKKLTAIKARVEDFIQKKKELFEKRCLERRIRRCHGDVRTKNIFIHKNRIFIFDAVEFSEKIASCDVAAEVAFLAMDLIFYGQKKWADILVGKYIEFSGDKDILRLIDFYICYRALVESMVEIYTTDDPEVGKDKKAKAKEACKRDLDLAYRFAKKLNG